MLRTRALAVLASLGCATALLAACERSTTGPEGVRPSGALVSTSADVPLADDPAVASGLLDLSGGVLELAARPGYPLRSTLTVPAGVLDVPAYFDVAQQIAGNDVTLYVSGRPAEQLQAPGARPTTDDPIVLTVDNASAGTDACLITVVFSPPDGSEPIVVKASLMVGEARSLGFRRGRSKYSVIYF